MRNNIKKNMRQPAQQHCSIGTIGRNQIKLSWWTSQYFYLCQTHAKVKLERPGSFPKNKSETTMECDCQCKVFPKMVSVFWYMTKLPDLFFFIPFWIQLHLQLLYPPREVELLYLPMIFFGDFWLDSKWNKICTIYCEIKTEQDPWYPYK